MIYSLINVKVWLRLKWMFENDADLKCFILLSAANKWKEGESRGDVCADERREKGAPLKAPWCNRAVAVGHHSQQQGGCQVQL